MRVPAVAALAALSILSPSGPVRAECVWPYTDAGCARSLSNKPIRIIPTDRSVPGSLQAYRNPGSFVGGAPKSPRSAFASGVDPAATDVPAAATRPPNETAVVTVIRGNESTSYRVPREARGR